MRIPYETFIGSFLNKITEFNFVQMDAFDRNSIIDEYMGNSLYQFNAICKHDIVSRDDKIRELTADIPESDVDEIVDIVSEGMLVQWMKPFVYRQENLENVLSTKDFSTYSPAELLLRISNAYAKAQKDYTNMIREYSYNHGDLSDLHL